MAAPTVPPPAANAAPPRGGGSKALPPPPPPMEYSLTPLTTIHDEDGKIVCCGVWKGTGALSTRSDQPRRAAAGVPPSGAEAEAGEGAPVATGHCRGVAFFLSASFEQLQRMESRSRVTGVQVAMISHKRTAQQAAGGRAPDGSASSTAAGGRRASTPASEVFASSRAAPKAAPERSVTEFLERWRKNAWHLAQRQVDFTKRLWRTMRRGDAIPFVVESVTRTSRKLNERLREWLDNSLRPPPPAPR